MSNDPNGKVPKSDSPSVAQRGRSKAKDDGTKDQPSQRLPMGHISPRTALPEVTDTELASAERPALEPVSEF